MIKDFQFLDEKKVIILTESGYLKVFSLKKRVSTEIETIDLFNFLDEESKMNPNLQVESLNICKRQEYIVVSTNTRDNNSNYKLMIFKREIARSNKSTSNLRTLKRLPVPLPPSSPDKVKRVTTFKYTVDAPNKGVLNSAIGTKFFDSYILSNPIMFFFSSSPQVMTTMIFYEKTAKKICTVETLHSGNLINAVRTDFHLVSIGDNGIVNALQVV